MGKGETRNWAEAVDGQLEDRGFGLESLLNPELAKHGARTPIHLYALFENARRAKTGLSRTAYALKMGELFAPFTQVAAGNPHAMAPEALSAAEIAEVTPRNRIVSDPFPRRVIARDQANQGAAVLLTSVGKARALGVPQSQWVYLHGGADVTERVAIQRQDLATSPASVLAAKAALDNAGASLDEIKRFDIYSCFPIAVFNLLDGLDISAEDKRPLTATGGLPFFGGAGNNYSMHGIASMIRDLRAHPGQKGLVTANGGFMSKYSVGVYSTEPKAWTPFSSKALQAQIDAWPAPALASEGEGVVESYTIDYGGPAPVATVVARNAKNERFVALVPADDVAMVQSLINAEPLGGTISASLNDKGRAILTRFTPA
jgi:acetyl-CoA C-acetyltransferase